MCTVLAALDQSSVWFWIIVGVGTAVGIAIGRWLWMFTKRKARLVGVVLQGVTRDWVRQWIEEPVGRAEERADAAATHAEELKSAVGTPNGHGDLMTIATEILGRLAAVEADLAAVKAQLA